MGGGGAAGAVRVLLPAGRRTAGDLIELDEDESHHLRVRRAEPGGEVELRDGAGLTGAGTLEADGRRWLVRVTSAAVVTAPVPTVLAVGAGDRDRFTWLAEKAAELGVTELVPIESERTAGVASRLRAPQIEKLARRAREAIKQSGAAWAPSVREPIALAAFLALDRAGTCWLADASGSPSPEVVAGPVTVLIGPEGGFTDAERADAESVGWTRVRFAPAVLRFETAALAAAASIATARERKAQ